MRKETVRGTLIAVAIVAALAGSDGIADAVAGDQGDTGTVTAAQMVQAASRGSGVFGSSEAGVPADFESSVFSTEGFGQLQHTPDGRIVGMVCSGAPEDTMELCKGRLQENGWTYIESGQGNRTSFLKQEGSYTWAYVDCTAVGDDTSVVVVLDRGDGNAASESSQ